MRVGVYIDGFNLYYGGKYQCAYSDPTAPTPRTDDLLAERDALRSAVAQVQHTRARATYIVVVVVAIVLLIFILQNTESAPISFLGWTGHLPLESVVL